MARKPRPDPDDSLFSSDNSAPPAPGKSGHSGGSGPASVPRAGGAGNNPPRDDSGGGTSGGAGDGVSLHEATRSRYLNYALSVITSRALPDVRDGLKPVQRRILFTMWQQGVTFDAKHRKCATVVGTTMGNYHPHGDLAIYDALVRMAQPFSLRVPLVDGSGNFGSLDGDNPAAMRYTECRLARVADELLTELEQNTVHLRPNYDGTKEEPVVLPARLPNLLLNGATGIAVGMATNIPPHNLGELCAALEKLLEALLDDKDISSRQLCRYVKGPDFPTGGQIISSAEELKQIYETGQGSVKIRATWKQGEQTRAGKTLIVTSVPYTINKAALVEEIAQIVIGRKLPPLLDVKDVSTDDVRIELLLKKEADEQMVMAYLFKHTALQTSFAANLTMLVPTENPLVGSPQRIGLKEILWHFLHFRLEVVTKRLEHELAQLAKRIHILEGFEKVFDALDEIIRIIRKSEGKADAAEKIMKRFELDAEQTDAILELKLYRLARLEILIIQKELEEKRGRVKELQALLKSEKNRWKIVGSEIKEIYEKYGKLPENKRRTLIEDAGEEKQYSDEDFIVSEDNVVVLSRDGWVKRQKEIKDLSSTRLREGDSVLAVLPGNTRATVAFFTNFGTCYTCRAIDVPATTGYGEPIQSLFKFKDGEKVVAGVSLDPRVTPDTGYTPTKPEGNGDGNSGGGKNDQPKLIDASTKNKKAKPADDDDTESEQGEVVIPPTHAIAVSSDGYALRFSLAGFVEPSTRSGRRYARVRESAEIVAMEVIHGQETLIAATREGHALLCKAGEVNFLSGPGRGVILIKTQGDEDRVVGFLAAAGDKDALRIETSMGGERKIGTNDYELTSRGGKGRAILQRGQFVKQVHEEPAVPMMLDEGE